MERLRNKIAVVYGDGSIGSTIAKRFAREGATVFLSGRSSQKLDSVASAIRDSGGSVETQILDALDEAAVEEHMNKITTTHGKIDVSFNAIGISRQDIKSVPLIDLTVESFMFPILTYMRSHFITAKAAARRMMEQGSGVILNHTPNSSRVSPPFSGGLVPAWAGLEALWRSLSVECGQNGVRTVTLLTTAIPDTPLIDALATVRAKSYGISSEQFYSTMAGQTHRKRLTTIEELANAAVFVASDEGSAITGTILNLTSGIIVH